jgi:hypothetical protein
MHLCGGLTTAAARVPQAFPSPRFKRGLDKPRISTLPAVGEKKLNNKKDDDDKEGLKLGRQERAQRVPVAKKDWSDWFGRRVSPAQFRPAF